MTDEYLEAMRTLWYDEHPEFHGHFVDFVGVDAHPRPLQRPIPVVAGGHRPPAYRRAVARAHGWYGYWLTPDDLATSLAGLRSAADRVERPSELGELGELEISVTPRGGVTPEQRSPTPSSACIDSCYSRHRPPRGPPRRSTPRPQPSTASSERSSDVRNSARYQDVAQLEPLARHGHPR
jgi:Luciferase-like monooxygenase